MSRKGSSKCNWNWQSRWAYIVDSPTTDISGMEPTGIHEYLKNEDFKALVKQKKKFIICPNGHVLTKYESDFKADHFKHISSDDINHSSTMTNWHTKWQGYFKCTEVEHRKQDGGFSNRRADAVVRDQVIEFQHSHISKNEVNQRMHDYGLHKKNVLWVIDGNTYDEKPSHNDNCIDSVLECLKNSPIIELHESNTYLIKFIDGKQWKYESFMDAKYVYLNCKDYVYRFEPAKVKSGMIDVRERKTEEEFVQSLMENNNIWDEREIPQCTLYHNQRGAGCGKTYESVQLITKDERFSHKKTIIYLSKAHTAKDVINNEFKDQLKTGKLHLDEYDHGQYGKQYKIHYTHHVTKNECTAIIGTIDSFIFALGYNTKRSSDLFSNLLDSLKSGHVGYTKNGSTKYARGDIFLNKECLIIIDEAQDLKIDYIQGLAPIMRNTYIDVYVIGDKLQSIWYEDNIYTYLECNELPHTNIVKSTGENIVRRFHNSKFISFVNSMIDFGKFNLPKVTGICDGNCKYKHDNDAQSCTIFQHEEIYPNERCNTKLNRIMTRIIGYMTDEVERNNYLPYNFMFIFPFMKKNGGVNVGNED